MSWTDKVKNCKSAYESYYAELIAQQYTVAAAIETCSHYYLDGKPTTKGLTQLGRSEAFWNCRIWHDVPVSCYELDVVAIALGRAIRFGLTNISELELIIQLAPELLKRAIRYSQLFLTPESSLWLKVVQLSSNALEDFKTFLRVCNCLREELEGYDCKVAKQQKKLDDLTVFEFLLYGSLYAFQNIVPRNYQILGVSPEGYAATEENANVLNQLLASKLKTRHENDFRLNERFLGNSLKRHLTPYLFPTEESFKVKNDKLNIFNSLVKLQSERNNYWSRTIVEFCFDDDYRCKFEESTVALYKYKSEEESDWDRNGRKLNHLYIYWLNRALIVYSLSELDDTPFGLPENDAGNREAFIKSLQTCLQLNEIYGMGDQIELPDGIRVDLFLATRSIELMSAFFKIYHIAPFLLYYEDSGDWLTALRQLAIEGISEGENRFPLTWADPSDKAKRIESWTVSDSHPHGDIKMAKAILDFWTSDLFELSSSLKKNLNLPIPEFHERPILQLGSYGFQLPWLMSSQNNCVAAINNLRRIGSRRGSRKQETYRIEQQLGELFESKGFKVLKGYTPQGTANNDPGEVDLICFLEGHLFILEVKSTYIRRNFHDAWLHYTNTVRKAAQQLKRKKLAILSSIENDKDFCEKLGLSTHDKIKTTHSWIVDTSLEYDQQIIDGSLKVSLEGLIVILNNERYLLRGLIHDVENVQKDELFMGGFSAGRFAEIVEGGELWSILDE